MLTVYYIYREIFNHFLFEWTIQEWLQTIDHRKFQSTLFSLKRTKMLHLSYDDYAGQNRRRNESSSTQKKESSIQTVIWLINRRANSHEKNKSSSDFRTTQKTAYWRKNRNRTSLRPKVAQRTTLFQRSRAFLIKSLSVLPFLDAQGNKSRSVVTILSEVTRLLRYLRYKAIASSIFYQKE